ncbi:hypothetical protein D910_08232 [Dendroctonus ponderosae]|uniref:Uncharacterized protein n=1 Tax=Dendroctonus ponderosae TaxID=77166 RepID=U4UCX6_DENPD|nr:hypothetical protein D910_08232 [Dendroctonus ponderosae]
MNKGRGFGNGRFLSGEESCLGQTLIN